MHKSRLTTSKKDFLSYIIITLLCLLLSFSGIFNSLDYKIYDLFLHLTQDVKDDGNITLVEIDNESISAIGEWPWTRNILGNAVIRLRELGASSVVFDIEYLSPSSKSLSSKAVVQRDKVFETESSSITQVVEELSAAVESGSISREEIGYVSQTMIDDYITPSIRNMKNASDGVVQDNDLYFSQCLNFNGNSYLTVNTRNLGIKYSREDIDYAKSKTLLNGDFVSDKKNLIEKGNLSVLLQDNSLTQKTKDFMPALNLLLKHSAGAGFTNVVVDSDGSRRRIELLNKCDQGYLMQLALCALKDYLGITRIERIRNCMILHTTREGDIKIPLDSNGCMLINFEHKNYAESFKDNHESLLFLYQLDLIEENIITMLECISTSYIPDENGNMMDYYLYANQLLSEYNDLTAQKQNILENYLSQKDVDFYIEQKNIFLQKVSSYVQSNYIERIMQVLDFYDGGSDSPDIAQWKDNMSYYFEILKVEYGKYERNIKEMGSVYNGSICFIGNTASSSTDMGAVPFDKTYANLGIHANIANTIIQKNFITPLWTYNSFNVFLVIIMIAAFFTVFFTRNCPQIKKVMYGTFYNAMSLVIPLVLFISFRIYTPFILTFIYAQLLHITITVINFMALNKDKQFIQNVFGSYVSPKVVEQIIKDPEYAGLGGRSEYLTALFSDIKTFSSFSEVINNEELNRAIKENQELPEEKRKSTEEVELSGASRGAERLVTILNEYLGVLSDAIMDNGGTIDKYVGDEIVSFFGAPVKESNNAFNACVAGIRMLQAEEKYNTSHKDQLPVNPQTGEPFYLHSRVGLNTGSMVVGNMGTDKKLNYTIMGNNVNLASRLEGVNKAYGSWIMVSETTWLCADSGENKGRLVSRKLDYVRVINVKKPVRIYNILGLREEMSSEQIRAAELFNRGMELYLKGSDTPEKTKDIKDIKEAKEYFIKAWNTYPEDKSSIVFIKRCNDYIKEGLPPVWDGVFTMKSK